MGLDEFEPGRTGFSVAQLSDGEEITVEAIGEAYVASTEHSDKAIHAPVAVVDAPDTFEDMSGQPVEAAGDSDGEPREYNIINSSTAFYNALTGEFGDDGPPAGTTYVIRARQPDDSYSRYYEIEGT